MAYSTLLLVILILLVSMVCAVTALCSMYLIQCVKELRPQAELEKDILILKGLCGELERQIDNVRKSYAGTISARKKRDAKGAEFEGNLSVEELRALAANGGE